MPHFAARQHDSLRAATGRRHHLNLLLHDYDEVNFQRQVCVLCRNVYELRALTPGGTGEC